MSSFRLILMFAIIAVSHGDRNQTENWCLFYAIMTVKTIKRIPWNRNAFVKLVWMQLSWRDKMSEPTTTPHFGNQCRWWHMLQCSFPMKNNISSMCNYLHGICNRNNKNSCRCWQYEMSKMRLMIIMPTMMMMMVLYRNYKRKMRKVSYNCKWLKLNRLNFKWNLIYLNILGSLY